MGVFGEIYGFISKSEAIERISKRSCKGRGKNYTAGYMDGLETAKRVVGAMNPAEATMVRHTTLVRGYVHGESGVFKGGCCEAYMERMVGWCRNCKHVNLADSNYCSNCGAMVDKVEEDARENS